MNSLIMHPEDLTIGELDYELKVRNNISGLFSRRDKTLTLRRNLKSEADGTTDPPVWVDGIFDEREDFEICERKILELNDLLASAYSNKDWHDFKVATSRLIHLLTRLDRLVASFPNDKNFAEARECVNTTLYNVKKFNAKDKNQIISLTNDFFGPINLEKPLSKEPIVPLASGLSTPIPSRYDLLENKIDRLTESFENFLKVGSTAKPSKVNAVPKIPETVPSNQHIGISQSLNPFLSDNDEIDKNVFSSTFKETPIFVETIENEKNRDRHYQRNYKEVDFETSEDVFGNGGGRRDILNRPRVNFPQQRSRFSDFVPDRRDICEEDLREFHRPERRTRFPERNRLSVRDENHDLRRFYRHEDRPRVQERNTDFGRCNIYEGRQRLSNPVQERNILPFGGNNQYFARNNRKSIPINQWNVKFSGEDNSLSLSEFLGEVDLFAESEGFSDRELFASAIHLFSGYARKWFKANYTDFNSWHDLVRALKEEFQSEFYDFILLSEIYQRFQGREENFSSFLAEMIILFGKLCNRLSEQYKLYILRKNTLKTHAMAIATLEINSIRQLSTICKRLDTTKMLQEQQNTTTSFSNRYVEPAFKTPTYVKKTVRPQINVLDPEAGSEEDELCEIRRKPFYRPNSHNFTKTKTDKSNFICFNCNQVGHVFRKCPVEKTRDFCFGCGLKDVKIIFCPNCNINSLNEPSGQ